MQISSWKRLQLSLLLSAAAIFISLVLDAGVGLKRAWAIPAPGEYVWDINSSITGSFSSDGSHLSTWSMAIDGVSIPSIPPLINDDSVFIINIGDTTYSFKWVIPAPPGPIPIPYPNIALLTIQSPQSEGTTERSFTFSNINSVPEPTLLMQLALGIAILACVGYVRRRRRAGLQLR